MVDILELIAPVEEFQCPSLEDLVTSADYFGLTTASPLQRAICRLLDGKSLDDLAFHPDVLEALGGADAIAQLPAAQPKQLLLLAGIRSGKSLLAAATVVRAALTCDVSALGPGEVPRAAIVSLSKETAQPALDHIVGRVMASPKLRSRVVGKPLTTSITLRHPSGRPVEITVSAGAKAGGTLVARWLAGVIFDEAPRFASADDGVINIEDQLLSIAGRMLPGAQIIMSGSPWAPYGFAWEFWRDHWGKPNTNEVVIKATGPQLNPKHWTPERCAELQARDPDAYRVDVLCEFMDPEAGLLSYSEIEACIELDGDVSFDLGHHYVAAIDPATRGNAWTLVVLGKRRGGQLFVAFARQWIGSISQPLSPTATFGEISEVLQHYRCNTIYSDEWSADALQEIAGSCGLWLISKKTTATEKLERFTTLKNLLTARMLQLPNNNDLKRDLASVRKVTTATGVAIHLPLNASGRHCDYAPALALAIQYAPPAPDSEESILNAVEAERIKNDEALAAKEKARLEVLRNVAAQNKQMRWK